MHFENIAYIFLFSFKVNFFIIGVFSPIEFKIMNLLKRTNLLYFRSNFRYFSIDCQANRKLFFENLSSQRSLIRISGYEVHTFLQGLITNDINHVKPTSPNKAMFTMFLNKQGRVLYDAIIYKCRTDDKTVIIECDRNIEDQLKRHLQLFRVRKKISIDSINDELCVWTSFERPQVVDQQPVAQQHINIENPKFNEQIFACLDPRIKQLGMRIIASTNYQISDFQNEYSDRECSASSDEYNYLEHRYSYGISEGIIEISTTKSFPFEANCDFLHGISFHKGCYLGQEFTARTYHTGVIRKRLMPLILQNDYNINFEYDTPILNEKNQNIGKLKGHRNRHAIGVLKVDEALKSRMNLKICNLNAITYRPDWWPKQSR